MRVVLFHILVLLVTGLYCVVVPQARAELWSDAPLNDKVGGVAIRLVCVYVCFLFVYFAVLRSKARTTDMPDEGAYGGYVDEEEEPQSKEPQPQEPQTR